MPPASTANPDLLGHVYVGPYVVGEPAHALVAADEDGVAGYCLAARDTRRVRGLGGVSLVAVAPRPVPAARRRHARTRRSSRSSTSRPSRPPAILEAYPAHLHIDLLERVRGTGIGRRLIERQLQSLADAGAAGCHLDVAAANANAIAFYGHLGWEVLERGDEGLLMGVSLR